MKRSLNESVKNWKTELITKRYGWIGISQLSAMVLLSHSHAFAVSKDAEQIYDEVCMVCHGDDGSGNMPGVPDLSENMRFLTEDNLVVLERIKVGIQSPSGLSMPERGGNPQLTDEQLLDVLIYLKKLLKK